MTIWKVTSVKVCFVKTKTLKGIDKLYIIMMKFLIKKNYKKNYQAQIRVRLNT